jgi:hypothetical protein
VNNLNATFNLKNAMPIIKSIVNYETGQIITQISRKSHPKMIESEQKSYQNVLGYVELVDLREKALRYIEVPKQLPNVNKHHTEAWQSYSFLSATNEAEFLIDVSSTKPGNLYTLDFNGNLHEWETSVTNLVRSLDDWKRLILSKNSQPLKLELFKESPRTDFDNMKPPTHGKVDEKNEPHVGGNTWAGEDLHFIVLLMICLMIYFVLLSLFIFSSKSYILVINYIRFLRRHWRY